MQSNDEVADIVYPFVQKARKAVWGLGIYSTVMTLATAAFAIDRASELTTGTSLLSLITGGDGTTDCLLGNSTLRISPEDCSLIQQRDANLTALAQQLNITQSENANLSQQLNQTQIAYQNATSDAYTLSSLYEVFPCLSQFAGQASDALTAGAMNATEAVCGWVEKMTQQKKQVESLGCLQKFLKEGGVHRDAMEHVCKTIESPQEFCAGSSRFSRESLYITNVQNPNNHTQYCVFDLVPQYALHPSHRAKS